ncbi:MAG TPA: hypothetical protein VLU46_09120 [Thermoanaerobaculia bacterium]|nr:hypothetical protein [Thermoanaerobaculia bacterium]
MKRAVGHYLLLTLAVVFFLEEFVFLTSTLTHAGRHPVVATRFLVLTIGVFLTAVAALYGFIRTIAAPGLAVVALLMIQPAIGAAANAIGGMPQKNALIATSAAVVGVGLLIIVAVRNRL